MPAFFYFSGGVGAEWENIIIFQQKPISQPQASLYPKGNISIPLLMEQISNQNMYSKIIEAMQWQHIMLPSAFPGVRNQLSRHFGVTESQAMQKCQTWWREGSEQGQCNHFASLGCSRRCLEESFCAGSWQPSIV